MVRHVTVFAYAYSKGVGGLFRQLLSSIGWVRPSRLRSQGAQSRTM
jgi:hypothetical protein